MIAVQEVIFDKPLYDWTLFYMPPSSRRGWTAVAINEALMNLRKRRSAEVSLDECCEMEEGSLTREVTDRRATPEESCSQLAEPSLGRLSRAAPAQSGGASSSGIRCGIGHHPWKRSPSTAPRVKSTAQNVQATLPKKVRCVQSVISIEYVFPRQEELRAQHRRSVTRFGRMSLILLRGDRINPTDRGTP